VAEIGVEGLNVGRHDFIMANSISFDVGCRFVEGFQGFRKGYYLNEISLK
jgi:hypothetical protein